MESKSVFLYRVAVGLMIGAGVCVWAVDAAAQDRSPAQMMMRSAPLMMAMMEGPETALHFREQLELDAEQVERLESVGQRAMRNEQQVMVQIHEVHGDLAAAMGEQLNESQARAALVRIGELNAEIGLATLRARQETLEILTPAQRERLSELAHQQADGMLNRMRRGSR
jgi:Spy/CpxP family protein refolding chaperone